MATKRSSKPRSGARRSSNGGDDDANNTRDIWKGSIAFGLVEIPVALVSAEAPGHSLSLSYLDRRDFSPVGYIRYNKRNDKEVAWSDIVRGYEYAKGKYVVLGRGDLANAAPEMAKTISIELFVDQDEIDPIYLEKPYYVEPLKSNSKSYALLRETLKRTKKVGVARFAIRTRGHVGIIGVREKALVIYSLRYHDEVRPPSALDHLGGKGPSVSPKEIAMAERLVEDMSGRWDPKAYKDEYVTEVMKVIKAKAKSGDVHALNDELPSQPKEERGKVIDLMPLLRESLEGKSAAGRRTSHARRTKAKARRRSA